MTEQEALQKAIDICGSQEALAGKIRTTQASVSRWTKSRVAAEAVLPIEKATGGQVTRHELRPDLYPEDNQTPAQEGAVINTNSYS